jgi:hypothetical protein
MKIETRGMKELLASLDAVSENLPKDVYSALGAAGTKVRSAIAKEVTQEIRVKQKLVKENTSIIKRRENLTVTVKLKSSARIPLRDFNGLVYVRKRGGGVKAKINKAKGAKKLYRPGFLIAKFGNHAFTRPDNGRRIAKLKGPSPYGVIKKNDERRDNVVKVASDEIKKQMERRIRFVELKKAGGLNWQK